MRRWLAAAALAFALPAQAQQAAPDPRMEARMKALAEELRCLVCQNQTIADSNAPLAQDLRNQIRTQIGAGSSDDQIRDYMVQRYGDFVLYKPPLKASTVVLWGGPFLLLVVGAIVFARVLRRRPLDRDPQPTPQRRASLEALLLDDQNEPPRSAPGKKRGRMRGPNPS